MGATVFCRNCKGTKNSLSSKPNLYTTNKYKPEKPLIEPIKDNQWLFSIIETLLHAVL